MESVDNLWSPRVVNWTKLMRNSFGLIMIVLSHFQPIKRVVSIRLCINTNSFQRQDNISGLPVKKMRLVGSQRMNDARTE